MKAVLGLGANLGDRMGNLQKAVFAVSQLPDTQVLAVSGVYETEPFDVLSPQDQYLNACLLVETKCPPEDLLASCLQIESALGRVRTEYHGARTVDIDILLVEGYESHTPRLTVPHTGILERAFVLVPLLDLFPTGEALGFSFGQALAQVDRTGVVPFGELFSEKGRKAMDRKVISVLETVDVATGERRVEHTFDKTIEAPNWLAPDTLLYNSGGELWFYTLSTGESTLLDTGTVRFCNNDHVISPDGKYVGISSGAAGDWRSAVYICPLTGGEPRRVTENTPSYLHGWSPDGKTLAYCAERNGNFDVYTIPVEGGEETRLTVAEGLDDGPEYAPDGQQIWFNSVRSGLMQVWRMNPDGTQQVRVTQDEESNCWFPHLSPDGRTVAYIAYKKGDVQPGDHPPQKNVEIRLIDADGGNTRVLVRLFGGQGTLNVNSWSPDGKRLAFVSYRLAD